MRRFWNLVILLVIIGVLTACQPAAPTPVPEPSARVVKIAMGFIPNVQFTPFYVAIERGYFADEGLVVELDYGMETDLLQQVGSGALEFAVASGDQVIIARASGMPVRYVANWYRRFPVCIVSLAEAGITSPSALAGKTVGTPAMQGASYIGWEAFVRENNLVADAVKLQVIGYTQLASLVEGRVDAAICYAMNEPVQLEAQGEAIDVLYLDQYTALVSNGIITSDKLIADDPELVARVVRAFTRGLADTIADPQAAMLATRRAIPEMDDEAAILQMAVLQECINFWQGTPLGSSDPQAWQESVTLLQDLGMLSAPLDPEQLYTNQFVPQP
ncbi:MAG: ABC transporter substrate-binding protein [Chloroflexi bacterium]|nr:ABC transporter substrate-binding protein [Chloroflexota bacterium]